MTTKAGQIKLWIETETGMHLVLDDLQDYNLDKSPARAAVIEELASVVRDSTEAGENKDA